MSLRPDSVYRVDLRGGQHDTEDRNGADSPPKVLQIRLTEQALRQLANAYASSDGSKAQIRIAVDPADPLLVIGDTSFQLHAPLPASGSRSASDAASTSTAPHELYKLSKDESTLYRIGTISTKLSVKPTRDVSAVAQRLKQQKEEEEQRKEERRKALMAGASPQLSASSSSRTGINKTLANVRTAVGSPSLASSPLSRSSSWSKLSSRREPSLLQAASVSNAASREPSLGARGSSPAVGAHARLQGASYDVGSNGRAARASTDSPKTAAANHSRGTASLAGSSRTEQKHAEGEEEGQYSEDERGRKPAALSSPASGASDLASGSSKKTTKLTTRQRLAKATKAGSRLLAVSERKATPERRTALTSSLASPPSKSSASIYVTASSRVTSKAVADDSSTGRQGSPPRAKAKEAAVSEPLRRARPEGSDLPVDNRTRGTTSVERIRKASPPPTASTSRTVKDEPAMRTEHGSRPTASASIPSLHRPAASADRDVAVPKAKRRSSAVDGRDGFRLSSKAIASSSKTAATSSHASPASVQVVTMRKARTSTAADIAATNKSTTDTSTASRPSQHSEPETSNMDRSNRSNTNGRLDRPPDREAGSPTKQATARKSGDYSADVGQRKRRRTNDFVPSDHLMQNRDEKGSSSVSSTPLRRDESLPRTREPSREGSIRRVDPASPREGTKRGGIPVSASMPSFASSGTHLQAVPERADRDAGRPRKEEYHDRRRDRSYDEDHNYAYRENDDPQRGRNRADDVRNSSSRGVSTTPPSAAKSPSAADRPIKGVGPGATHWSEPWLDVRSRSDWHRLAQRFAKTQEEYLSTRKRLEAENERLDRELELASNEEQEAPRQSLLFSPHKQAQAEGGDVEMQELEVETAVNTSINSRNGRRVNVEDGSDGNESPEEGEMRSDDEIAKPGDEGRRSESPDNLAWRGPNNEVGRASGNGSQEGAERPLSYTDLANRVQQLVELHGSLSRMHRVLVDFKSKGITASVK